MTKCTEKGCREHSMITHKPMKSKWCWKHWEQHCEQTETKSITENNVQNTKSVEKEK